MSDGGKPRLRQSLPQLNHRHHPYVMNSLCTEVELSEQGLEPFELAEAVRAGLASLEESRPYPALPAVRPPHENLFSQRTRSKSPRTNSSGSLRPNLFSMAVWQAWTRNQSVNNSNTKHVRVDQTGQNSSQGANSLRVSRRYDPRLRSKTFRHSQSKASSLASQKQQAS
jgi:hypothetical protein